MTSEMFSVDAFVFVQTGEEDVISRVQVLWLTALTCALSSQ